MGYKVQANQWNVSKQQLKAHVTDATPFTYDYINDEVLRLKRELSKAFKCIIDSKQAIAPEMIKAALNGEEIGTGDFIKLFADRISYFKQSGRASAGYIKHYETIYNDLITFAPVAPFTAINTTWLERLEAHMAKSLSSTTVSVRMRRIKELLTIAVKKQLLSNLQFIDYKFPVYKNPVRPYITLEQVESIANKVYDGTFKGLKRDIAAFFVVECYSGIRHSDWSRFKVEKIIDDVGFKVRAKKNGEPVYLYLKHWVRLSKMVDFITDNGIVYNSPEQVANKNLKTIGEDCGIDVKLTTHVGRHTASTLLAEMGYNDSQGAEILGISPNTFAIYRKMTRQGSRQAQERLGGL
jgi:hypothetical protein